MHYCSSSCEQESSDVPIRNRLLLPLLVQTKTGRTSHISVKRVEDKRVHNITYRHVIREQKNYRDVYKIPHSDPKMTVHFEHNGQRTEVSLSMLC